MRRRLTLLLIAGLLAAGQAAAFSAAEEDAYRAVFSAAAIGVPRPSPSLVTGWTLQYRGALPHAAFAFARDPASGKAAWSFVGGRDTPEEAASGALAACERQRASIPGPCTLLAQDGRLVSGSLRAIPTAEGSIGPFRISPFHLRRGPERARGVFVWGHGYGGTERDNRSRPSPGIASILNDAGWDVLRFDRDPGDDTLFTTLPRLIAGLPALRAAGYRAIVLGGQSRGGWQALLAAAEQPDQVAAVIATAPAAHGEAARPNTLGAALDDFRRLLASLPPEGPRALVALFDDDAYDPDPERRAETVAEMARDRPSPLLALWPDGGIRGHDGVADWRFTRFFGGCVLTLVQAPAAGAPRGLRRDPCGGG